MLALPITVLLAVPLVLLGLVIVARTRPVIRVGHNLHDRVAAAHRHTSRWRLAGLGVGLLGSVICAALADRALGRVAALAPVMLVAGILLGTIIGELTARTPQGSTRQASVAPRRVGALVTRGWVSLAGVGAVLLSGVLALGWALGGPDDLGRAGRALVRSCTVVLSDGTSSEMSSSQSPWPGSFYVLPLLVASLLLAVLTVLALRSIALRRSAGPESELLDGMTRQWAARNVLLAASFGCLLVAGVLASIMASHLQSVGECAQSSDVVLFWVLALVGTFATPIALTLLGALFLGPRLVVDDLPLATPGPAAPAGVPVR
jgi:hypothetical protein